MSRGKEIALKIKADIDSKLGPTFKAMAGGADNLGQALGKLERQQRQLTKLAKLDKTSKQAQKNYEEAAKHYDKLRKIRVKGTEEEKARMRQEKAAAKSRMLELQRESIDQTKVFEKYKVSLQKLKIPLDNYKKTLSETTKEISKLSRKQKILNRIKKIGGGIKSGAKAIGSKAAKAAKFGIVGGMALASVAAFDAGRTFIGFNQQMKRVQALSRATQEDFKTLESAAIGFGSTTAFTSQQAGQGMEYLALAGFKTNEILETMPGLLSLAAASGEDLGSVADIVSDNLSAFNLKAKDAGKFADIMAAASSSTNTTVGMLGEAFSYVAAPAAALGGTVEEVSAVLGIMADNGIKASQAGTSLRSAYLNLAKPTKEASKAMKKLGLQTKDKDGNFIGMTKVIQQLQSKFSGLTDAQRAAAATSLFGKNAVSGMLSVINSAPGKLEKLTESFENSDGAAKKMADTMLEGPAGATKLLSSAWDGLKTTLGKLLFTPGVLSGIKTATGYISGLASALSGDFSTDESQFFKGIIEGITGFAEEVYSALEPAIEVIKSIIPKNIDGAGIFKTLGNIIVKMAKIISEVLTTLSPVIKIFVDFTVGLLKKIYKGFDFLFDKIINGFRWLNEHLSRLKPPKWLKKVIAKVTFQEEEADGSHKNGLSNVPFDGYKAILHKGERVLTAGENEGYQGGSLVSRVKQLKSEAPFRPSKGETKIVIEDNRQISVTGTNDSSVIETLKQLLDKDRESLIDELMRRISDKNIDTERMAYGTTT